MQAWLFLFAIVLDTALLFTMVFYIVMFSDLECDMINPLEMCSKLNPYVYPEMAVHALLTLLMLLSGNWTAVAWNMPLLAYHGFLLNTREHGYDPTEIFPRLTRKKVEAFGKMAFFLLSFFYYLYRLVLSLIDTEVHLS